MLPIAAAFASMLLRAPSAPCGTAAVRRFAVGAVASAQSRRHRTHQPVPPRPAACPGAPRIPRDAARGWSRAAGEPRAGSPASILPAAQRGRAEAPRPDLDAVKHLKDALDFEAARGYNNAQSQSTGRLFSTALMSEVARLQAVAPQEAGNSLQEILAGLEAYNQKSRSERCDLLQVLEGVLAGINNPVPTERATSTPVELKVKAQALPAENITSKLDLRPIVIDLEATGLSYKTDRIVEVAALGYLSGRTFESLVRAEKEINYHATKVNGITNEMIQRPDVQPVEQVLRKLLWFIEEEAAGPGQVPVLVAHNGRSYDFNLLDTELGRMGMKLPDSYLYIDTLAVARQLEASDDTHYSQDDIRKYYNLEAPTVAHRAMADVKVLSDILSCMVEGEPDPMAAMQLYAFKRNSSTDTPKSKATKPSNTKAKAAGSSAAVGTNPRAVEGSPPGKGGRQDSTRAAPEQAHPSPARDQLTQDEGVQTRLESSAKASTSAAKATSTLADPSFDTMDMFQIPVAKCRELTPAQQKKLQAEGFHMVEELVVGHLPRSYLSWKENVLEEDATVALTGYVLQNRVVTPRSGMAILNMTLSIRKGRPPSVEDGKEAEEGNGYEYHRVQVSKFMQGGYAGPALYKLSSKVPVGSLAVVKGKLVRKEEENSWQLKGALDVLTTTEWAKQNSSAASGNGQGELQPVYSSVKSLSSKDFTKIIPRALNAFEATRCAEDPLPGDIPARLDLMPYMEAIRTIHSPGSHEELEAARRRLAFQELFMLQLGLLMRRQSTIGNEQENGGLVVSETGSAVVSEVVEKLLSFTLTRGQRGALADILGDMSSGRPMLRLLQGDVGSGKTIVAFLAMLAMAASGQQVALMAPTEVLAAQHMKNLDGLISSLRGGGLCHTPSAALLTGSTRTAPRREVLEGLADGSLDIVIGTHSLIGAGVEFRNLGLAVIDEQHRFGVEQRSILQRAGVPTPHVLTLSATPIPRTLALVAHGDMDLSIIPERPPGRTEIKTQVLSATDSSRNAAYELIRRELAAGFRSYVICPLVEASEVDGFKQLKAAEDEHKRLQEGGYLGDAECGLLHGRMTGEEKAAALQDFASGKTHVLISTSVVEVGVDVPEASVMIVEHAERFGLAQLHQLRGRIGRGTRPSECVMLVDGGAKALDRVKVLEANQDGFAIAEADLEQRGPGEVLGTRQSGAVNYTALQVTRLPEDADILDAARAEVSRLLEATEAAAAAGSSPRSLIPMRTWAAYSAAAPPELDFFAGVGHLSRDSQA